MRGTIRTLRAAGPVLFAAIALAMAACNGDDDDTYHSWDDDSAGGGSQQYGEDCSSQEDCVEGLVCAGNGICVNPGEPGTADEGEDCVSSEYCQLGLVCAHDGTCQEPGGPGTGGQGDDCEGDEDCQLMMQCLEGGCYGFQLPLWLGTGCAPNDSDPGDFRVLFEVPGEEPLDEFYKMPFPNDARVEGGHAVLEGHPSPGALIPALGDVVGGLYDVYGQDNGTFGTNQAAFMRFSHRVEWDTAVLDAPGIGNVYVVDITAGADEYGEAHPVGFRAAGERGAYICYNWVAVDPSDGWPYLPGHTYAFVLHSSILQRDTGVQAGRDADFDAVMQATPPGDARLQHAWEVYEPFRAWAAGAPINADTIAGASVYTVQDPTAMPQGLRTAVRSTAAPDTSGHHLCQDGDGGPYADENDETRGCDGAHAAFCEVQGLVTLPAFQDGTPPFKEPADGGAIHLGGGGAPEPVGTEDVVFSLTVPRGEAMPPGGWPLVLYGHGTGGNYRSFVANGMAEALSDVTLDDGTHVRFAVLSIDAVMHGPRRHEENFDQAWLDLDPTSYDPDVLFFNVLNPRAARDNALQGAADYFALTRLVEALAWSAGESPTGEAVSFDADQLYYMGHSQGSNTGVVFATYEPQLEAAVFSGAGGLLIESMLNKTKPYDLPTILSVALADPDLHRWHPVLNIVQGFADVSDPINHARHFQRYPMTGIEPRHGLHTYGIGDTFTPDVTQYALTRGLRFDQVTNGNLPLENIYEEATPVDGNKWIDGHQVTGIVALYEPNPGNDGHYVVFDLASARRQVTHFLGTAVRDGIPTVVAP